MGIILTPQDLNYITYIVNILWVPNTGLMLSKFNTIDT